MFDLCSFDYIVDALGTISSKLLLIRRAAEAHVPLISCMDIGNKLDPSRLEIADIGRTTVCPVTKMIERPTREKLFRRSRTVVKKSVEGNISFVMGTAGYLLAGEVVRDILAAGSGLRS